MPNLFRTALRRLINVALVDSLTLLGNNRAFFDDLEREVSRARRHQHQLTLAFFDIDDFRMINDLHGHRHGDKILTELAKILDSGRIEDRAYRLNADTFAVLFTDTSEGEAKVATARMRDLAGEVIGSVSISIGLCELGPRQDQHDLRDCAEAALAVAKRHGHSSIVEFSAIQGSAKVFSSRKSAALVSLLKGEALEVAFQPIWHLDCSGIIGFEALARPDSALGFSSPQEAFDIAERTRVISDLDALCVRKVLSAASGLPEDILLFINMTPETLSRSDFDAQALVDLIVQNGLRPEQIVIEVTERRIVELTELIEHAKALQARGIRIALDDTGSGYAGLEILSRLSLDFVKIDRAVIVGALTNKGHRGVLTGIVTIAHEAESQVIAEGIETIEQLQFLRSTKLLSSITGAQGYFLGRPEIGAPRLREWNTPTPIARARKSVC